MSRILVLLVCACFLSWNTAVAQPIMEKLGRGVVAVRTAESSAYVGWRLLATDPARPRKLNSAPLTTTTDFIDTTLDPALVNAYTVRAVVARNELEPGAPFVQPPHPGFFLGAGMQPPSPPRIGIPR